MRNAIRERLLAAVPEFVDVYEPHAAGADSKKPFAVVFQGDDEEESNWAGFRRIIEIWPHVSRTSFAQVDALADKVIAALDQQLLSTTAGEVFSCLYMGAAGSDAYDDEWHVLTRGLRFSVVALQAVNIPETTADDSWITALTAWTQSQLADNWRVYSNRWPLGYRRPSVMWRLLEVEALPDTRAAFLVRKRIVGHVIGRTPNEQSAAAMFLAERLQRAVKIPLDLADRRYLTVISPRAALSSDAISTGQLAVTLSRRTLRPSEDVPLMNQIGIQSNM